MQIFIPSWKTAHQVAVFWMTASVQNYNSVNKWRRQRRTLTAANSIYSELNIGSLKESR